MNSKRCSRLLRVVIQTKSKIEMQFPAVNATIKLSPVKKEKKTTTGNLFVVKEVKSANERAITKKTAGSKVIEISVPREALKSRSRYQQNCALPSVPLIEVNINKHGFQVRILVLNVDRTVTNSAIQRSHNTVSRSA